VHCGALAVTASHDRAEVLARACAWIDTRLETSFRLAPFDGDRREGPFWASLRAIGELAHAADFLIRNPCPAAVALGRRWLDHAWRETAGGEVILAALAADPRFLPGTLAFVPFQLAGCDRADVREVIARQLRFAALPPLDWTFVVPALELLGIPAARHRPLAAPYSVLARQLGPGMPRDAAYILAHECSYAARWGHEPPRLGEAASRYVHAILPALVARSCTDQETDLLADLILASCTTGVPVAPAAFDALELAQTLDGNVAERARRSSPTLRFQRLSHPTLDRTYHTTMATIMAWATMAWAS